jgi:hypothetical protein
MADADRVVEGGDCPTEDTRGEAAVSSTCLQPVRGESNSVIVPGNADSVNADIDRLIGMQKELKAERKRVAKDLKNAQRRRKRLKHRARLLSSEDLHKVLSLRIEEQVRKEERERRQRVR